MATIRKILSHPRKIKIKIQSLSDIRKTIVTIEKKSSALKRLMRLKRNVARSQARGSVRGRPKQAVTKQRADIRFDPDVLKGLKSYFGRGWSTRVNDEMRNLLVKAGALDVPSIH
ncbi:MAG: BrnA antitoxin family protein [Alphaproteobacteria bacterium]|nr:BrnA antitoxin family protein [Alphaproteobacteria bacterium]